CQFPFSNDRLRCGRLSDPRRGAFCRRRWPGRAPTALELALRDAAYVLRDAPHEREPGLALRFFRRGSFLIARAATGRLPGARGALVQGRLPHRRSAWRRSWWHRRELAAPGAQATRSAPPSCRSARREKETGQRRLFDAPTCDSCSAASYLRVLKLEGM